GVFLAGEEGAGAKRVGELDEVMVYESRVGDTITLGTSTWRIVEITPHQVRVLPAPGLPGRLPFWIGDTPGRAAELGEAIGRSIRELGDDPPGARDAIVHHPLLAREGLDEWARNNLLAYLHEQREAAGVLPDDKTIVVERYPDELGDWRVVIHSLWGARVNAPWAAILAGRLREIYGLDAQVTHCDDGIVLRMPETAEEDAANLVDPFVEPDRVTELVTESLAGSAHFAARFREAAARALLLPRRRPDRRQPLWQQRQRAAQLLAVAARYDDFPIVHEAVRECLQDDFDVPTLLQLMRAIEAREVRVVEVSTPAASPFAAAATFRYTAQFLYDLDAPLAERRAAALSLDPGLLAELLGGAEATELADLLDPGVVLSVDEEMARRTPERQLRDAEALSDALRVMGPLDAEQIAAAGGSATWAGELVTARRAIEVRMGGRLRWAAVEDAGMLRDGLGAALPAGLPEAFTEPVADPLGALVRRYARGHGLFTAQQLAGELGIGIVVAERELGRLVAAGVVTSGRMRPTEAGGGGGADFCDVGVLARLRRRSLAALRKQVEPVDQRVLGAFAPRWHQFGRLRGVDGVLATVSQLAGAALPASAIESLILPARVLDYRPAMLDELITAGELAWVGQGKGTGADGTVRLLAARTDDGLLARVDDVGPSEEKLALLEALRGGGAYLAEDLAARAGELLGRPLANLRDALWELAWSGWVTADSFSPVRAALSQGRTAHKATRQRVGRTILSPRVAASIAHRAESRRPTDARTAGRWSLAPTPAARGVNVTPEQLRAAQVGALMERHGILTRGGAATETSFASIYPVLSALEDNGTLRRGYFVEHLGGSQFALPPCPDALRSAIEDDGALVLAACDPANPYGAALAWPPHAAPHRPGRGAGSLVVLVAGDLVLYVERGGHTALTFSTDPAALSRAAEALVACVRDGRIASLRLAKLDGNDALAAHRDLVPLADALVTAGFNLTPQGLRIRGNDAGR
ncbi:MAG: DEAD/DEAH box helicase, partial [Micrococcales bacterium]|nr:DEAD/DEAH box helicase [Micrococcales bacterium]